LTLLAGACVTDDGNDSATGGTDLSSSDIVLTSARLEAADSCDALLDHLISEGVERVGPYGFGNGGYWGPELMEMEAMDDAMEESSADSSAPASPQQGGGDESSFSGTNNQEADVEEADRVKTDGERLIIMRGNTIEVFDVTGDEPEPTRSIQLDDNSWGAEMFLVGDSVLLLSNAWSEQPFLSDSVSTTSYRPDGVSTSKITEVDLITGDIGATVEIEGNYLSAREVDGSIRIVTTSGLGNFDFLFPSNEGAEEAAERANRAIIEESTIEQWIPTYRQFNDGDVVAEGQAFDCTDMYIPTEFSGFGALTILTVDIDDGLSVNDSVGVLSDGQTVYASTDRLTVASNRYPEWDWETGEQIESSADYTTSMHTFDISEVGSTEYVASGSVMGSLLSQYSLSEHDGFLRVATTDGSAWDRNDESQSMVTVLEERGDELVQVGFVDGLGEGEQIFAVRFMGEVGYVVTFRQIDPLYTVDLSDPTDPTVLGELKIPGFSTYLHPVGEGLLLGVGQDASDEGRTTGAQVSLFDVSDLTDPLRVDQASFGENSYSSVGWDPKAFLFWGERKLAVVPVSSWNYDEETGEEQNEATAVLVQVNDDNTLTEIGRIGHPVKGECESNGFYDDVERGEGDSDLDAEIVEDGIENAPDVISEDGTTAEEDAAVDAESSFVEDSSEEVLILEDPPVETIVEPVPETAPAPVDDYCWSYQPEIRRSVIIGNSIFTISELGVQRNDLDNLSSSSWSPFD